MDYTSRDSTVTVLQVGTKVCQGVEVCSCKYTFICHHIYCVSLGVYSNVFPLGHADHKIQSHFRSIENDRKYLCNNVSKHSCSRINTDTHANWMKTCLFYLNCALGWHSYAECSMDVCPVSSGESKEVLTELLVVSWWAKYNFTSHHGKIRKKTQLGCCCCTSVIPSWPSYNDHGTFPCSLSSLSLWIFQQICFFNVLIKLLVRKTAASE